MRLARWIILLLLVGCSTPRKSSSLSPGPGFNSIRYLGDYHIPHGMLFDSTVVGGLSGIDFNPITGQYYLVSDDPSTRGPARFYTADIQISDTGFSSLNIKSVTVLRDADGSPYADIRNNRMGSADVESIRFDPTRQELVWTTEGQRIVRDDLVELQDPAIVLAGIDGRFRDSLPIPDNMHITSREKGPRHNSGFEGVAFDDTFDHIFVSLEDALYDDGQRAGTGDSTAWIRILKYDRRKGIPVAQFAYQLDPVPHPANPPGAFKINGVSEILYAGNNQLLVVERAWSTGRTQSDVRLYLADLSGADNVMNVFSVESVPGLRPVKKRLLLDLNTLGIFIDNIEGICLGPKLPNGRQSMLLVVDDNFDQRQKNQFLLFEVR